MKKIATPEMQNNKKAELQECRNAGHQFNAPEVLNV
jgi:hypothetical protein